LSHVGLQSAPDMWTLVNGYDARLVNLLIANRDVPRSLVNLVRVPIGLGNHRTGHSSRNASRVRTLIRIGSGSAWACLPFRVGLCPRLPGGRQSGDAAVRRIDDQPRPAAPGVQIVV